jgi:hypothetical protein
MSAAVSFGLNHTASPEDYHVLLIGDWGGDSDEQPITATQNDAALRMGEVTAHLNTQFVLLLGDNFYHHGVTAETGEQRFTDTFENCFSHESLGALPFYAIAGNHDHRGDVQVQVDFTGKGTGRWNMPSLNYNVDRVLPDGKKLRIVMFDSVETSGMSYMHDNGTVFRAGPTNLEASQAILDWVEQSLAESDADFLFTAAHYPVYSGCSHGNVMLSTTLPDLMEKYDVRAHLAGHDHCMQHIVAGTRMHVQTGAGADNWYKFSKADGLADVDVKFHIAADNAGDANGGFTSMSFSDEGARFTYFANNGDVLYTSDIIPPRSVKVLV